MHAFDPFTIVSVVLHYHALINPEFGPCSGTMILQMINPIDSGISTSRFTESSQLFL